MALQLPAWGRVSSVCWVPEIPGALVAELKGEDEFGSLAFVRDPNYASGASCQRNERPVVSISPEQWFQRGR